MVFDISTESGRRNFSTQLKGMIDAYAMEAYNDGPRSHLGASIVGQECARAAWYSFRWFVVGTDNGRMARLFRRGHLEELRFIEYLKGIGAAVYYEDAATGKQFKCNAVDGHMGGSLDAIVEFNPAWFGTSERVLFLGEFKTKGTGSGFDKLKELGIRVTNPTHFAQMSLYGSAYNFKYAIYFSVNKNDDDLHVEVVPLDHSLANSLVERGRNIVYSEVAPPKCSLSPQYMTCKMCSYKRVCHDNAEPAHNCRTCVHSHPVQNGAWYCDRLTQYLDKQNQLSGCDLWTKRQ